MIKFVLGLFLLIFSKLNFAQELYKIKPVLLVVGTRPEGIKVIPVYKALKKANIPAILCSTFQHQELLQEVFDTFNIQPDIKLNTMKPNQDLFYLTNSLLSNLKEVILKIDPSIVLVQGDTTTAMASSLASYYLKVPVGHIEAGLRTHDIYSPFPEEINRKFISSIAKFHFATTEIAVDNLIQENIDKKGIYITGNTVIDALKDIKKNITNSKIQVSTNILSLISSLKSKYKSIVLLTAHRRESFEFGLESIFSAFKEFALKSPDTCILYIKHPNPNITKIYNKIDLSKVKNFCNLNSVCYKDMVYILDQVDFVATDSGGLQEEAASLNKRVIVLRDKTERVETLTKAQSILTGTNKNKIIKSLNKLTQDSLRLSRTKRSKFNKHIYGDGTASEKIANIIHNYIFNKL